MNKTWKDTAPRAGQRWEERETVGKRNVAGNGKMVACVLICPSKKKTPFVLVGTGCNYFFLPVKRSFLSLRNILDLFSVRNSYSSCSSQVQRQVFLSPFPSYPTGQISFVFPRSICFFKGLCHGYIL